MISKELLSEVLGINITHTSMCKGDNDLFFVEEKGGRYINIYELAHKCKEWALSKGYQFKVYFQTNGIEEWQLGKCGYGWDLGRFENCIQACELILNNKETQCE